VYVVYEHAAVFKDPDTALAWAPHVQAAIERAGDDPLDRAALVENVGVAHLYRPDAEAAQRSFEESLRLREEAPGQHALAVVSSLGNLGVLYEETHRYDEAIEQHERALALLGEYVGEHHPHTARVIDNLGTALLRKGDVAAAIEHFGRALEIRRTVLGPRHRSVGVSSVHFGLAALQQGDPDAAIEHYGTALDIYEDVFAEDAIDVLQVHEGLAHAWAAKEDWTRTRTHARTALDGLAKVLPTDHPELVALREILGLAERQPSGGSPAGAHAPFGPATKPGQ
jgi:tetratricopeptide (TPR) repeat protein